MSGGYGVYDLEERLLAPTCVYSISYSRTMPSQRATAATWFWLPGFHLRCAPQCSVLAACVPLSACLARALLKHNTLVAFVRAYTYASPNSEESKKVAGSRMRV